MRTENIKVKRRIGFYNRVKYKHIVLDGLEFIVDEEIGAVYRVVPEIIHGCESEIELKTDHYDISEVFGILETLTINQFKNLGGVL